MLATSTAPVKNRFIPKQLKFVAAAVTALLVAACGATSTSTATGPTPVKCAVSLVAPENAIAASGGAGAVTVTTQPECAWTAAVEGNWIGDLAPASGQGSGEVRFQVTPNPDGTTRQGAIDVNGQRAVIRQDASPCRFELALSNDTFEAEGGVATVELTAPGGCAWAARSGDSWIVISAPATGTGRGVVSFRVMANAGPARSGTIAIGDAEVTVAQEGVAVSPQPPNPDLPPPPPPAPGVPAACTISLQPTSTSMTSAGGSGAFTITTPADCSWTARSLVPWVTIGSSTSGRGSTPVAFSVAANPGAARSGTLDVGGQTFTVNQAAAAQIACVVTIDRNSQSVAVGGSNGVSVAVSAPGCAWTATSNVGWITITAGASGSGNGKVAFNVAANGGSARTGTLTIGGNTFTVSQAGQAAACAYSINPSTQSMGSDGGPGNSVAVSTTIGCAWTAQSNAGWLTITSGSSGTGNGTVVFSVAANTGSARTGTLTIAGQSFTLSQAASCSYAIKPSTQSIGSGGGSGNSIAVSTTAGCAWTAASNAGWLTITSGSSGTGNGTVVFSVAANTGSARTGTLTIAGETFTLNQAASCSYSINPSTQSIGSNGGSGNSIAVSATAGCAWTAASNAGWLTITSGSNGTGNGTVVFSVAANTGSGRTGTLTIAGQTFTLNQAASCSYSIDPVAQAMTAAGGAGSSIGVTTSPGCAWTAASNANWLSITSGSSGSGNGNVGFSVAANTGSPRTGTLTIAGRTFTVLQAAACTYSISPSSASIGRAGGDGPDVDVSAPAGCAWTATSNDGWLTIRSGESGTGNGRVRFRVAAFAGESRTGTLTIAGQTFTVTQARSNRDDD
jgi:ABC-type arginine transport system ATPase subunit